MVVVAAAAAAAGAAAAAAAAPGGVHSRALGLSAIGDARAWGGGEEGRRRTALLLLVSAQGDRRRPWSIDAQESQRLQSRAGPQGSAARAKAGGVHRVTARISLGWEFLKQTRQGGSLCVCVCAAASEGKRRRMGRAGSNKEKEGIGRATGVDRAGRFVARRPTLDALSRRSTDRPAGARACRLRAVAPILFPRTPPRQHPLSSPFRARITPQVRFARATHVSRDRDHVRKARARQSKPLSRAPPPLSRSAARAQPSIVPLPHPLASRTGDARASRAHGARSGPPAALLLPRGLPRARASIEGTALIAVGSRARRPPL